jgi:outer membrane receptor protein involved in Fe transport
VLRRIKIAVDGYFNSITDKIVAVPRGSGQYRWMMLNIGYVQIRGVDAFIENGWSMFADVELNIRMSYTYSRAQDLSTNKDGSKSEWHGGQIAYIPVNSGSMAAGMEWSGLGINYSFLYTGGRWTNSANITANYVQPWYTHDIAVTYTLGVGSVCRVVASFSINNVLNQYYDVILNYPMPGRNYNAGIKVGF